jgi:hypothetical protein
MSQVVEIHQLRKNMRKNTFCPMTLIFSHSLRNLPFAITAKTCNIGLEWSWGTCAGKMILEAVFDNAHTTNAENGKSSPDNLQNAEGVGVRNIAARSVRRALGSIIATGVLLPHSSLRYSRNRDDQNVSLAMGGVLSS